MRVVVLALALLPFLVYAGRDLRYHLRQRKPGIGENVTHLFLGVFQMLLVTSGFRGDPAGLTLASLGVVGAGAVDEYAFHRGLPEPETDMHAKGHFALFIFLAVAVAFVLFPDAASVQRALHFRG